MSADHKDYGSFKAPEVDAQHDGSAHAVPTDADRPSLSSDELPEKDAQAGVQQVEAVTAIWSRQSLVLAYIM